MDKRNENCGLPYDRCYYPHLSRDSLSPVCGIFFPLIIYCVSNDLAYLLTGCIVSYHLAWRRRKARGDLVSDLGNKIMTALASPGLSIYQENYVMKYTEDFYSMAILCVDNVMRPQL